jgi:hypothetical protein
LKFSASSGGGFDKHDSLEFLQEVMSECGGDADYIRKIFKSLPWHSTNEQEDVIQQFCNEVLLLAGADSLKKVKKIELENIFDRYKELTGVLLGTMDENEDNEDEDDEADNEDESRKLAESKMTFGEINLRLVQVLHSHGVDLGARDLEGNTALHAAALVGNLEVITFLLDEGIAVDEPDYNGCTPLARAACCGQLDAVDLLLHRGADIEARNSFDDTLLFQALHPIRGVIGIRVSKEVREKEHKEVVQMLLER